MENLGTFSLVDYPTAHCMYHNIYYILGYIVYFFQKMKKKLHEYGKDVYNCLFSNVTAVGMGELQISDSEVWM